MRADTLVPELDEDIDPESPEARLAALRPHLATGAVFAAPDSITGRTPAPKEARPIVLVGSPPPPTATTNATLSWKLPIATRVSWKSKFGSLPASEAEMRTLLRQRNWVFTPAGLLPAFDLPGVFETEPRRWVTVDELTRCQFLDWLPLPYILWLTTHTTGARLPDPYPPPPEAA